MRIYVCVGVCECVLLQWGVNIQQWNPLAAGELQEGFLSCLKDFLGTKGNRFHPEKKQKIEDNF